MTGCASCRACRYRAVSAETSRLECGALPLVADEICKARWAGVWASMRLRPPIGTIAFSEPDIKPSTQSQ